MTTALVVKDKNKRVHEGLEEIERAIVWATVYSAAGHREREANKAVRQYLAAKGRGFEDE